MPGSIAVIGSLNIDFITRTPRVPAGGETLEASSSDTGFGGKGANQAVACARLSRNSDGSTPAGSTHIKVSMVGFVGEDSFGSDIITAMKDTFIDTTHIQKVAGQKTGIANIIVEEKTGENRILFCPNANFSGGDEAKDLVPEDADVVVFQLEMPLAQVVHNIKLAHSKGKYVVMNPAPAQKLPEDLYQYIDCLIMNESEADILREAKEELKDEDLPQICEDFFRRGVPDMVVITLGAKGVYHSAKSRTSGHTPGRKAKVVDTTAAGDTFVGGLAVEIAKNGGKTPGAPAKIIEFANSAAARTVEKPGAMSAIPWLNEL
ncbi:ribokinase-like protein [Aureobasidium subglaciale]|nr:ribokinase-like protein [Aureobasidium subglaciale]